jgi:hypothetical protein
MWYTWTYVTFLKHVKSSRVNFIEKAVNVKLDVATYKLQEILICEKVKQLGSANVTILDSVSIKTPSSHNNWDTSEK